MKYNEYEERGTAETADKIADTPSALFEDMRPSSAKPGVVIKLYGMDLMMDETAGKLIITNSILKNAPAGNLLEIQEDEGSNTNI